MKLNRSWLMTLCLVGLGALLILPSLGISIGSIFGFLLVLLCPLSHLLMMRGGHGRHGGDDHDAVRRSAQGAQASLPGEEKKALEG